MEQGLVDLTKQIQNKYYGKYRGFVNDNNDPDKRGRLRLTVPSALGEAVTGWALPCLPFGGLQNQGWFAVPEVGAQVWVEFEEGELSNPIWTGTFWQQPEHIPEEAAEPSEPTTRVFKTPSGHVLQFDDEEGEERFRLFHPSEAEWIIDPKGSITFTDASENVITLDAENNSLKLEDANGNTLTMDSGGTVVEDANGNKIEMASSGITVEGQQVVVKGTQVMLGGQGGEPLIKGQTFLSLFATHMHPTGVGPSGPPIPQGEMSSLSTTSTTT
ncbi:phage baseplate assembly protein V [Nitrospina sp. 32_T5]|uniref:phage baseplate assembly protein V n=1 Tax=unclassified Nitrospina TaxID=2638683 RepID=UPI003F97E802